MQRVTALVSAPRSILVVCAVLFGVTAVVTASYPPEYLSAPVAWSAVAIVASVTSAWCIWTPGRKRVAVAGTAAIVAALGRSIAIFGEVLFHGAGRSDVLAASFWLAAFTWAAMAILLHAVWVHVVLPWAVAVRSR